MYITKTLQELTIEELANIHLDLYGNPVTLADGYMLSGMGSLVTEIQQSLPRTYTGFFSPLYGAFALLDQIGEIYSNKTVAACPNPMASGIKKGLYNFCNMVFDGDEMKALYGLRNSLMHDGSLLYRGRYDETRSIWRGPFHRFRWNKDLVCPVKLPESQWDGNLETLSAGTTTEINVREICQLALSAVERAADLLKDGNLGIHIREGDIELYYRYLFHQSR